MTDYTIRNSIFTDAIELAPHLRPEDVAEVLAAGSESAEVALMQGFHYSKPCLTVDDEHGNPCLMMGVVPTEDPMVGAIWLLSSDIITRHPVTFLRQSKPMLQRFHQDYPVLCNAVDARNTVHIKWLKWLGFTFINTVSGDGEGNLPFHTFVRLSNV